MPSLLLSSQAFLSTSALSSRRVPSRHRHCTARGAGGAGVAVTTALFTKKKGDAEKAQTKTKTPSSRGRNLISPKPLYAAGNEPWYIDPKTGKAPAYLQLTAFMASQLFVGLVMVPFSIWWQQVFEPILNK
mmetsp:Transcript_38375/g.61539  ORF Transcript_38375/g.61539 Transcript_38375/m.61539 type:complete len:131 (+) Transcript_38375:1942-2334(+)